MDKDIKTSNCGGDATHQVRHLQPTSERSRKESAPGPRTVISRPLDGDDELPRRNSVFIDQWTTPSTQIISTRSDTRMSRIAEPPNDIPSPKSIVSVAGIQINPPGGCEQPFWVPAHLHPEVHPSQFKKWLTAHADVSSNTNSGIFSSLRNLRRTKSFADNHVVITADSGVESSDHPARIRSRKPPSHSSNTANSNQDVHTRTDVSNRRMSPQLGVLKRSQKIQKRKLSLPQAELSNLQRAHSAELSQSMVDCNGNGIDRLKEFAGRVEEASTHGRAAISKPREGKRMPSAQIPSRSRDKDGHTLVQKSSRDHKRTSTGPVLSDRGSGALMTKAFNESASRNAVDLTPNEEQRDVQLSGRRSKSWLSLVRLVSHNSGSTHALSKTGDSASNPPTHSPSPPKLTQADLDILANRLVVRDDTNQLKSSDIPAVAITVDANGTELREHQVPSKHVAPPRYVLEAEQAVYRHSHYKLAQPRRSLLQQVLISNLMVHILAIHGGLLTHGDGFYSENYTQGPHLMMGSSLTNDVSKAQKKNSKKRRKRRARGVSPSPSTDSSFGRVTPRSPMVPLESYPECQWKNPLADDDGLGNQNNTCISSRTSTPQPYQWPLYTSSWESTPSSNNTSTASPRASYSASLTALPGASCIRSGRDLQHLVAIKDYTMPSASASATSSHRKMKIEESNDSGFEEGAFEVGWADYFAPINKCMSDGFVDGASVNIVRSVTSHRPMGRPVTGPSFDGRNILAVVHGYQLPSSCDDDDDNTPIGILGSRRLHQISPRS
ncbi:hypothetical protein SeLEV6574_g04198 [Synchytrium endobioticum]|uniref:Protein Zds1 C-terminal domain-containing protein n=1 Tax=Synchytrium endobioticum TaxID=286115 RepID=A0A507D0F3_9FUNG|nr:hypothetical protein SeLEV6574_g04198 [Synchytrium endobioticum]